MSHCRAYSKPNVLTRLPLRWLTVAGISCAVLSAAFPHGAVGQKFIPETGVEESGQTSAEQEVITLGLGKPMERELSGGFIHFTIATAANHFHTLCRAQPECGVG